jgi:hypothetical protein
MITVLPQSYFEWGICARLEMARWVEATESVVHIAHTVCAVSVIIVDVPVVENRIKPGRVGANHHVHHS